MTAPDHRLYGHQTELAIENFPISGEPMPPAVIHALASVKAAAAVVNARYADVTGVADDMAVAIGRAASEVAAGDHDDQFPIDVFQTGSGTSTNMNVNEVVASLASATLGRPVHPNDHVNASQSSNDTIPTAIRIALLGAVQRELIPALAMLQASLELRAEDFSDVVKAGRTHLMDATPVTVGQEFGGWAAQVAMAIARIEKSYDALGSLPIGGTAVGTGLNAPVGFGAEVAAVLSDRLGLGLREAEEHFSVQGSQDDLVAMSGLLRSAAVALYKVASDIRLLASGPRTGLAELVVPPLQPGSSIMPGKANPVMCEVVTQVAAQVIGNDAVVTFAGTQGALELNTYLPVMARNLLGSTQLLTAAATAFAERCVDGIEVDRERCRTHAEATTAVATALNPHIGYEEATAVVREAVSSGRPVRDVVVARGLLSPDRIDEILDPLALTRAGVGRLSEPPH